MYLVKTGDIYEKSAEIYSVCIACGAYYAFCMRKADRGGDVYQKNKRNSTKKTFKQLL